MGNIISNTMGNEAMIFNPLMLNSELRINNQTSSVFQKQTDDQGKMGEDILKS